MTKLNTFIKSLGFATALFAAGSALATNLTGAGATFPYPLYAKWAEAYKAKSGIAINYQSIGSGGGIKQITAKTVDFGASDMPLKPEELDKQARLQRLPDETSRKAIQALLDDLLGVAAGDGPGGLLVVHDAWWVPDMGDEGAGPLAGDVDNNHHTEYLRRDAEHPRALPQDSPQPQPQLAVQGAMLFALGIHPAAGPGGPAIIDRCQRWLQMALAERGIGGRTYAAGAGRFQAPLASGAGEGGGH